MPELGFPRRIILGEPASEALKGVLQLHKANKILVVSDPVVSRLDFYKEIIEALKGEYEIEEFTEVEAEPSIETATKAGEKARGKDAVVAIGGGSVIDVAKTASVLAKRPGLNVEDIAPFNPLGIELEKPVLIAVPTTAGTGSDASYGIVLSKTEPGVGKVKVAVGSYEVIPYATILDHRIPASAPGRVKVGAIADALSHALEALASTNSNPFSDALAEKAITLILTNAPKAVKEDDEEAWLNLHAAATMAGIAFSNSGLGLAHAIAHPLGALLGLHHGTTVGIVMLGVLEVYMRDPQVSVKYDRVKRLLEHVHNLPERPSLLDHVTWLYGEIGQPKRFHELGIDREKYMDAVAKASELAYHDPDIAFSPVIPSTDDIRDLLQRIY
ncbi:MAG: iron-containing alcohol dehydrogenase [Desulfurococcales archaeon]|nr:iron-containing alcohol dehydrogenase [Desulfurococcales archaeon]